MTNSNYRWAVLLGVVAVVCIVSWQVMPSALAALGGTGTSTFITVWSNANTITGYSSFTFVSSTKLFTVGGPSSLQGLTFTNSTGTGNLQAATLNVTGVSTLQGTLTLANSGGVALQLSGLVPQSSSTAFIQIGSSFANANPAGTYIGITATSSFSGDFLNFQIATTTKFSVSGAGVASMTELRTPSSTIGTLKITGVLTDAAGNKYSTSTGGAMFPGGSNKDVQFNNGGSFAADTGVFTYDTGIKSLSLNSVTSSLFIGTNANFATSSGVGVASSVTFSYTGSVVSWVVPDGVTSITINALGSAGQANNYAGKGGSATGTLAVSSGQTYYILVGATSTTNGAGGFGGGGSASNVNMTGSGGGGMSWFSSTSTFDQSSVILVAGGGGGNGSTGAGLSGGDGGGLMGSAGQAYSSCTSAGGGSQSSGGGGGGGSTTGNPGTAGQGGMGSSLDGGEEGSGGGGGYFGGGGGGAASTICDGPGGGGSSFMSSALTSTSTTSGVNSGNGSVTISYRLPGSGSTFSRSSASLYVGGHVFTGNQNLGTLSVSSCGSFPNITGNDTAGSLTVGSGGVTSCTVSFGATFANAPVCVANDNSNILALKPIVTVSTLTLVAASSFSGDTISFICLDHN